MYRRRRGFQLKRELLRWALIMLVIFTPFYFLQRHIESKQDEARAEESIKTREEEFKNEGLENMMIQIEKEKLQLKQQLEDLKKENEKLKKLTQAPEPVRMANMITKYFPEDSVTAIAVFKAESGLNPRQTGWNCRYGDKSLPCKPQDRAKAWSVDCGLAQINMPGFKSCPDYTFDPNWNLNAARKKYNASGWNPWMAWQNDKHTTFLAYAREIINY